MKRLWRFVRNLVVGALGWLPFSRYDRRVITSFRVAPLYPIGSWALMAAVTVRSTWAPLTTGSRPELSLWSTPRSRADAA